jgi:signal transduction histidine kinase
MESFRALAHGIYPPLLEDRGLAEALAHAARLAAVPTTVHATGVGRYDAAVEATVYFCCLESVQNVAKHAGDGARATVRIWEEGSALMFEIGDEGAGLDPTRSQRGTGLTNMRDRLGAVGGELRIESTLGRGTRVIGVIPLERYASRSAR